MSDSDSDNEVLEGQVDEDWEEWDGDEEEDDATKSLFSDTVLPNPEAAFEYDAQHHSFDLRQYKIERHLDDYDVIKVINFIRRQVADGHDPLPALAAAAAAGSAPWCGDEWLTPVLPDDPLITYDYEEQQQQQQQLAGSSAAAAASSSTTTAAAASGGSSNDPAILQQQLSAVLSENLELKLRVAALMEAALPKEVREEMAAAAAADRAAAAATAGSSGRAAGQAGTSSSGAGLSAAAGAGMHNSAAAASSSGRVVSDLTRQVDNMYFDSYSSFDIHHEMLSDKPRTKAYQQALTQNPSLLSGAAVLDVGCGTSILSMFAAKGGARAVVGLDGSERIAGFARQVVAANKLDAAAGGPISIVAGKVEEVEDIGLQQVDVIVSEWMGYGLLFESMLDSVLAARDKWLRPGGAVLPDIATIHAAGASREVLGTSFWQDVYGFNMSPIADELTAAAARECQVLVRPVEYTCLTTNEVLVHSMDLATMAPHQQDFTTNFELTAAEPVLSVTDSSSQQQQASSSSSVRSSKGAEVAAVVLWFETEFSSRFCKDIPVVLSTSPHAPITHWAQAVLPLASPVVLSPEGPGSSLACRLSMARSRSRHRALDISLEVSCGGVKTARLYTMEVSSAGDKA